MNYKIEKKEKSKILLKVEIGASDLDKFYNGALQELGRDVSAPGFRKGKLPLEKIEEAAGKNKVLEKAAELAVNDTYPKIIKDSGLEPLGLPQINVTKLAPGNPFFYEAEISVWPEVKLADWKEAVLSVPEEKTEVSDQEINDSLEWLRKSRSKYIFVDRPAARGDRLEIDVLVSQNGKVVLGGESKNHPVILGEGKFVPGLEDKIIGMSAGEEKEFNLPMPEKYFRPELAGREARFKVAVKSVQRVETPDLNEEFAKKIGQFESLANLKASVKDGLLEDKETRARENRRGKIIEKIAEKSEIDTPEILVEAEIDNAVTRIKNSIVGIGLSYEQYLAQIGKTEEHLRKELKESAEKTTRAGIVLREFIRIFNVNVSEEEVRNKISEYLRQFPLPEEAEKTIPAAKLYSFSEGLLKNEKVFEKLEGAGKLSAPATGEIIKN